MTGILKVDQWKDSGDNALISSNGSGALTINSSANNKLAVTGGSLNVEDGYAYGYGDNSYRIEGKDDGANARIAFITGNSEIARFTTSGLAIGGTGAANTLDDYETGSWTPNYSTEGGGESITYDGITSGSYVKIGKLVLITGNIRTDGWSGGSSYVYLGGFPFTVNSDENAKIYIGFARANNFTGESPLNGECVNGSTKAFLKYRTSVSGDHQNTVVSDMETGTNKNVIYFTGVYRTT